ncbi:MAG: hypothetical protein IJW16_03975 [Clostridia bacterium]|nr:hypothetical protein [Clostridia bacterium]
MRNATQNRVNTIYFLKREGKCTKKGSSVPLEKSRMILKNWVTFAAKLKWIGKIGVGFA